MKEIIMNAVFVALSAVVSYALTALVRALKGYIGDRVGSSVAARHIATAVDIVENAVRATGQTFVSTLKANGQFTADRAQQALQMAIDTSRAQTTEAVRKCVSEAYGDYELWLVSAIESAVARQKT